MTNFPVGSVLFTQDGNALYKAASATEINGFWDDVVMPWIEKQINNYKRA